MSFKDYDVKKVTINLAGITIDSGFAEDSVITVERDSDLFGDKAGADGEVTRFRTNDDRVTITIRLMQSSDKNALLSALYNLDLLAGNGAGVGTFLLKDNNGTTLLACPQSWIANPPQIEFGKEVKEREWKVRGVTGARFDGGN